MSPFRPAAGNRGYIMMLAGLLAMRVVARCRLPGGPKGLIQWQKDTVLTAYSCGGSSGFGQKPTPDSRFTWGMSPRHHHQA